jgi:Flp pilus assembly protein TadD
MLAWGLENTLVAGLFGLVLLAVEHPLRRRPGLMHLGWVIALGVLLMPATTAFETPGGILRRSVRERLWPSVERGPVLEEPAILGLGRPAAVDPLTVGLAADEPAAPVSEAAAIELPGGVLESAAVAPRTWIGLAWLLGSSLVLGHALRRVAAFQRLLRYSLPVPASLEREVREVANHLNVRMPRVRSLAGVGSPSIWCLGRPLLLWPQGALSGPARARTALIAHELAHLARRDHWVSWLEVPAAALFWWNPLFWLIRGRIRRFAELSCDAWAVWAYPTDRRLFAEALIDMQARSATAPVALQGLGATDSECKDFERRLDMIMKKRVFPRVSRSVASIAVVAGLLAAPGFSSRGGGDGECASVAITGALEPVARVAKLTQEAEARFADKDYPGALAGFREVLALDPENGKAHGRIGYILIGMGEPVEAGRHFERQYELGHDRPTALYNSACARALTGDTTSALDYLAAAVRHGFANTELMAKDSDLDAIRDEAAFEEQLERARSADDLRAELADLEGRGEDVRFLAAHTKLAEIQSADGELMAEHGHLALKAGDHQAAAWAFGRQAKLGHNRPTALYNRACALSLQGDVAGALADLQLAADEGMQFGGITTDHDLDNVRSEAAFAALEARITRGAAELKEIDALLQAGDLAAARPRLKTIAKDEKRSTKERAWAFQTLAGTMLDEGRYEDATAILEHAAGLGAGVDRCAFQMAQALAGQQEYARALDHVALALDLGFSDAAALKALLASHELTTTDAAAELVGRAEKAGAYGKGKYGKAWAKAEKAKAAKKVARDL